jgi:two-component system cell cycle sensor histidine kinase/response regulator CckA
MARVPKLRNDEGLFFERAPVALLVAQLDTLRIEAVNQKARSLLGRELVRKVTSIDKRTSEPLNLKDMFAAGDLDRISTILRSEDTSEESHSFVIRDPSSAIPREIAIVAHRIVSENRVALVIQELSPRACRPDQVRQSQRMEAMGMLAGGIAHDFNNLLTIIAGYSQMLQTSGQMKTERDRTALEQVLKACERAADLTAQLLSFSRRQNAQPKVVDVALIANQTAGMLRRLIGEDIELQIYHAPEAGRTFADAGQIQQLLLNLAINSRDAMPDGGTLSIDIRNVELGESYAAQNFRVKPGSYVRIEVSDTGMGMDETTRKRVFEPFFTTKPQGKGTGLGLSTVYGIVSQCGGSIDLYSEPGHGTTFQIYLPHVEEAASEDREAPRRVRGGHETLMLVEDEEGVRRMVRSALERCGYRVLLAGTGPEALEVAHTHEGPIDLLITDIVMPKMSGHELARRMLEERPGMPVLFMSGYLDNRFDSTSGDAPPAFMQKPFAPFELTARVREMLDTIKGGNGAARTA